MEPVHNTFTVPCKKYKMVSFASSVMKNIVAPAAQSRFSLTLIVVLLLDQHQVLVVYLNLLLSFYSNY